jgi:hypothetical protein
MIIDAVVCIRNGGGERTGRDDVLLLLLYRRRRPHRLFVVTAAPHEPLHTTLVNVRTNSNINGDDSCSAVNDYDNFLVFLVLCAAVPSIDASFLQNADAEFCANKAFNIKRCPVKKREREGERDPNTTENSTMLLQDSVCCRSAD